LFAQKNAPSLAPADPQSVVAVDNISHRAFDDQDGGADSSGRIRRAVEQHILDDAIAVEASDQALFERYANNSNPDLD
jgi:hypothetical protein